MEKIACIRLLKKSILLLALSLFCLEQVTAQITYGKNGTVQIPNLGFEEWDDLGKNSVEPKGWNSFMNALTGFLTGSAKAKQVDRSLDIRSSALNSTASAKIYSREIDILGFKIIANGNMTTGRVNAKGTSATSDDNHNFTERSTVFKQAFNVVPDSVALWVKFLPGGDPNSEARVSAIIHIDANTKDPKGNANEIVAHAECNYSSNGGEWQRICFPFVSKAASDPRYLLMTFSTNKNPGEGSSSDQVFIDDLLFIYNPTIAIQPMPSQQITALKGVPYALDIPFTITGIMTPNNDLANNTVMMQLSDANGSFDNPLDLGTAMETDLSGTFSATIPTDVPAGTAYRIRMVTTNYPMMDTLDESFEIAWKEWITVRAESASHRGSVSGSGTHFVGENVSLLAEASANNHFTHWSENGMTLTGAGNPYLFEALSNTDRDLVAHFDTNRFTLSVTATNGSATGTGTYIHGSTATLQATPHTGYRFVKYVSEGATLSTEPDYSFVITDHKIIQAVFAVKEYPLSLTPSDLTHGTTEGAGTYEHFSTATASATAATGYHFLHWNTCKAPEALSSENPYSFVVTDTLCLVGTFAINTYAIAASSAETSHGSVDGANTYEHFAEATLTATPTTGYLFQHWTENGTTVSTANPYTFPVGGERNLQAHFRIIRLQLALTAGKGGKVSSDTTVDYASPVTLTATPATGYSFVEWQKDGATYSTDASLVVTLTEDLSLRAIFAPHAYTIGIASQDESYGLVAFRHGTPSAADSREVFHDDSVHVSTTGISPFKFTDWRENGTPVSTNANYSFLASAHRQLTAYYSDQTVTVTVDCLPEAGGSVEGAGNYLPNDAVTLRAMPAYGYSFVAWHNAEGDSIDKANPLTFAITEDREIKASFTKRSFGVKTQYLPVACSEAVIDTQLLYQESLQLSAPTPYGYRFIGWYKGQQLLTTQADTLIRVIEEAVFTARYDSVTFRVATQSSSSSHGSISGGGSFKYLQAVSLQASANKGYHFVHWKQGPDTVGHDPRLSFILTRDTLFTAVFAPNSYTLTADYTPAESGSLEGAGSYLYGDSATLTARPAYGYTFSKWTRKGQTLSLSSEPRFTVKIASDTAFTAHFTPLSYRVALHGESAHGSTEGAGSFAYKNTVTVKALPKENFYFTAWKSGETVISTDREFSFVITRDTVLTAFFHTDTFRIQTLMSPPEAGSLSGGGKYPRNSSVTLTATANTGYRFVSWKKADNNASAQASFTFYAIEDASYTAHFEALSYSVTTASKPTQAGSITGAGRYTHGENVTLTAAPDSAHSFIGWTFGPILTAQGSSPTVEALDASQRRQKTITFKALEIADLIAEFRRKSYPVDATVFPENSGTIANTGDYEHGREIVLQAVPSTGYQLYAWTVDGDTVFTPTLRFVVLDTHRIHAIFQRKSYFIEVEAYPLAGGTVTGQGRYLHGDTATFTAQAASEYIFQQWVDEKSRPISSDSVLRLEAVSSTWVTAIFVRNPHTQKKPQGQQMQQSLRASVYPNPAKTHLFIEGYNLRKIEIYDMAGAKRIEQLLLEEKTRLELKNLRPGLYLYRIYDHHGNAIGGKIIVE